MERESGSLELLRVVALESRMTDQTAILIERSGGVALRAPSMREIPLADNHEALDFARRLIEGAFDSVIFLTGVGAKHLADTIETNFPAETWREALKKTVVVARGPKPLVVLRSWGVPVAVQVPEPNTWRDVLETLDQKYPVEGKSIAIQEYGQSNLELVEGLKTRGATIVECVQVYRWALPEDLEPLQNAIRQMIEGRVGALVVTSAQQIRHLFQVAESQGLTNLLREAINRQVIIASVGPIATETLKDYGISPDIEPEHPKLGPLVQALTREWKSTAKTIDQKSFGNNPTA